MSKSPEAFRTISEVAEELALPQHVLRFWETRFTSIRPMKRGGGRRYYRPDDVNLLRGIRALLYGQGYTIRGVQRILKEQGPRFVVAAARGDVPKPQSVAVEEPDDFDEADAAAFEVVSERRPTAVPDRPPPAAEADAHIEPTFDPREFRPASLAPANGRHRGEGTSSGLAPDEIRRLQATLSDLLELKRLLDHARE